MTNDISFDISNDMTEVKVVPKMTYTPTTVEITGTFGRIGLQATDEQLAELEYAIRQHLGRTGYHEIPDGQQILNHEHEEQIELEAAS